MGVNKWSEEEELLKKVYPNTPMKGLRNIFPNRSSEAIHKKANKLGLKKVDESEWSEVELTTLIREWPTSSKDKVQRLLSGRTWLAIKCKASVLGLEKKEVDRPIVPGGITEIDKMIKGKIVRFGIASDRHFGSKYAQITYLHNFYRECEKEGVDFIIDPGDTTDGNGDHYHGQQFEMHITGADELKDFTVKNYPSFKDRSGNLGKTYGIAGYHDLDLWVREGYDILKRVAEDREDYVYLGHASAVLKMHDRKIQILHPSGGTAYAISYRLQKVVESFSSENKPHILITGHFHKAEFIPLLRNVYSFQAGCFQAQTPFGVRKSLTFFYGGWIVEMGISGRDITHMKAEFIPFYKPIVADYRKYEI